MLLCTYAIYLDSHSIKLQIKDDVKKENLMRESFYSGSKIENTEYDGRLLGNLIVDSINLDKMIIRSSVNKLQYNLDLNNIVTIDTLESKTLFLYGHYTEVYGLVLNRLSEVKLRANFIIKSFNNKQKYIVVDKGHVLKQDIEKLKEDNTVIILTCTNDFSENEYYYVKGKRS